MLVGASPACAPRAVCDGVTCTAACPRDATRDERGRCTCRPGDWLVLGACVPPAVADAYCGPAAVADAEGCTFHTCTPAERLDAMTGRCEPRTTVLPADPPCSDGGATVVVQRRTVCAEGDETCPRGTRRSPGPPVPSVAAGAASEGACERPPLCPPGTLAAAGGTCRAVVTVGTTDGVARVDLGAWASLALGSDGGPGSLDLCRPLRLRADAFALHQAQKAAVNLAITLAVPDQDMTRLHAEVRAEVREDGTTRSLSVEAEGLVRTSLATLVEPLRGLGGEASTAVLDLRVSCNLGARAHPPE